MAFIRRPPEYIVPKDEPDGAYGAELRDYGGYVVFWMKKDGIIHELVMNRQEAIDLGQFLQHPDGL